MTRTKQTARKNLITKKRSAETDDSDLEPKSKKSKSQVHSTERPTMKKDSEGNEYWEISKNRRVGISSFKGMALVNIREYYEKDGEMQPGRKGISLSLDQYSNLISVLPDIEKLLVKKGEQVPRPNYDSAGGMGANAKDAGSDEAEEEEVKLESDEQEDDED